MTSARRIALNLVCLRSENPTGVENYAKGLLGSMKLPCETRVTVHTRRGVTLDSALGSDISNKESAQENLSDCVLTRLESVSHFQWRAGPTLTRILVEMLILPSRTWRADAVLSVNNFGPLFGKRGQRRGVVIHDIWFLSDRYDGPVWKKWLFRMLIGISLRSAHSVFTPTEFARQEIIETLGVSPASISVTPLCLGSGKREYSNRSESFFLLMGSSRRNKNVLNGVRAFVEYSRRGGVCDLVVVGVYDEGFRRLMERELESLDPGKYQFEGYVSAQRKWDLLERCTGLFFPTLYEGYGIPVIEALAVGKPTLVSRGTSCEEVQSGFGIAVDGSDVDAMADGLMSLERFDREPIRRSHAGLSRRFNDCESGARTLARVMSL